jgi:hypothetical protein
MSNYYKFVNVPDVFFDAVSLEVELAELVKVRNNTAGTQVCKWGEQESPFNKQAHDWINSLGLTLRRSLVFYTRPGNKLHWHDDGEHGDFVKFNFVWGSDNHVMQFGETVLDRSEYPLLKNSAGTYYTLYRDTDLKNVESVKIDKPVLFNGNTPHQVINYGATPRWCLSMILGKDNSRLTWSDALVVFNDFIVR